MRKMIESVWGAMQMAVHLALGPFLHRRRTRWGATKEEMRRRLPGDELIPEPDWSYNHGIWIDAPRSAVWPWLVQLGQGRGGFYSYEGLENLIGCRIHNVIEIRPELQNLRVGDVVRMHASGFGPEVMRLDHERALVLGGPPNAKGSQATWAFYLLDGPDGTTRLLERGRNVIGRGFREKLGFGPCLIDPIGLVMSKKMLRTIKRLVEEPRVSRGDVELAPMPGHESLGHSQCETDGRDSLARGAAGRGTGAVDLYWLPLGAGGHFVRLNGCAYEALVARLERRPACDLYHSALQVQVAQETFVIEQTPVPDLSGKQRGVVAEGAVGSRWASRFRIFRYEVRLWRNGHIPDVAEAVDSPRRLTDDEHRARRVIDLVGQVPTPVWGRDELGTGEMWNSNSVIAWVIARSGMDTESIQPPAGGRAPGWQAGLAVARRQDAEAVWTDARVG